MRNLGRTHNDSAYYMALATTRPPETMAKMAIVLIKQVDYLLLQQLETLTKEFLKEGGMREQMTRMRIEERKRTMNNG